MIPQAILRTVQNNKGHLRISLTVDSIDHSKSSLYQLHIVVFLLLYICSAKMVLLQIKLLRLCILTYQFLTLTQESIEQYRDTEFELKLVHRSGMQSV